MLPRLPSASLFPYTTLFRSGRVGRSNRVAYAHFTYQRDKVLTEVAEKRLQAIKEFTELGSGFKLAMRSEEHTSELQSRGHLVCRLLLEKKKKVRTSYDL